jgi:hypothetical protein
MLSPGTPVSSTNKTDRHDITEILLEMALNPTNHSNLDLAHMNNCFPKGLNTYHPFVYTKKTI